MKLKREGDNKIDYATICGKLVSLDHVVPDKAKYIALCNEYKPIPIPFRLIDKKKPADDKDNMEPYFTSWLSMYPNSDTAGKSSVTLDVVAYADEDMGDNPFRLVYDKEYFDISPETIAPIKKSSKGKLLREAVTITCKKELPATVAIDQEDPKVIKVMVDSALEKDAEDKPVPKLAGRLFVMPNDSEHRYRLKVKLVKVYLLPVDKAELKKKLMKLKLKTGYLKMH